MKPLPVTLAALLLLGAACSSTPHPIDLPPPIEATSLGVGDVFELHIVGEDKLPTAFTVASDGTVDLPYIKRIKVIGLEPQEVAETVRAKLIEEDILTDPSVSVSIKEYNSKRVEILGEVQKPGSIPLQPGMTLLRAISLSGASTASPTRTGSPSAPDQERRDPRSDGLGRGDHRQQDPGPAAPGRRLHQRRAARLLTRRRLLGARLTAAGRTLRGEKGV